MNLTLSPQRQALLQRLRSKKTCTGHTIVALSLKRLGITHLYCVPGTPISQTVADCASNGIRVIGARHQNGAVMMSLAHNYVSGSLCSAVMVSAGPAVTNCSTGMLFGHDNRWPLLVLAGRRSMSLRGEFQAFDGAGFFAPMAKFTGLVDATAQIGAMLERAVKVACAGPPGPVYLDLLEEALRASALHSGTESTAPSVAVSRSSEKADATSLRDAVLMLARARRPAVLLGEGARWSTSANGLRRLVEDCCIPFATSPMARGLLPDEHPLCFSAVRGRMLAEADVVLVVAARLDWTFRFGSEISPEARVIRVDIDPAEATNALGRGIALHGDACTVLEQLLGALDAERACGHWVDTDPGWLAARRADVAALKLHAASRDHLGLQPMSPYEWLAELGAAMPQDAITVLDGNIVLTAAQRMLPARHPARRLGPGTNGCMGVGIPFAIGAKLARPDLPVVAIVGDFAFGLSAIELETAVRHRVPVVIVVANNAGAGGAARQREFFAADYPERVLQFVAGIRHDLMMTSLGGLGRRVDGPGQIGAALSEAIAGGAPVCIDVVTNEDIALTAAI